MYPPDRRINACRIIPRSRLNPDGQRGKFGPCVAFRRAQSTNGGGAAAELPTSLVFVDATHVDHRCEEGFGRTDVDFQKFFDKLTQGTTRRGVVYCYAPYLFPDLAKVQSGAINRVKKLPGVMTYEGRHMKRGRDQPVEKGTDVAVASHLVQAACLKFADQLILVAGDNDYWPALEVARQVGAFCKVAYFVGADESDQKVFYQVAKLRQFCTSFVKLNQEFMADCWYTP